MCSVCYEHMFATSSSGARPVSSNRSSLDRSTPNRSRPGREDVRRETSARSTRRARRPGKSFRVVAGRAVLRILALALLVLVAWSILARPSGAHGPKTTYRVQPYDTLWTIAQTHYGGDARDGVWQIQQANHLTGTTLVPGERLLLP